MKKRLTKKNMCDKPKIFPPGVKPFRCPEELEALNKPFPDTASAHFAVKISIPEHSTIQDAMRKVYHFSRRWNKEETVEAWQEKLARDTTLNEEKCVQGNR